MNEQQNIKIIRQQDAEIYKSRNMLNVTNANMFISNNNNPFLVSPYAPPTNVAKTSQVNEINVIISSLIGALSSVINLSTYTLSICTITSLPSQTTVNISSQNIVVTGDDFNVESNANFYNISTGYLFASNMAVSTLTGNQLNINNINSNNISTGNIFASNGIFSTLGASSISISNEIIINSLTVNSTIYTSSMLSKNISTGNLFASAGGMSTLDVSSINSNSILSLNMSTNVLSTGNLSVGTIGATSITFQTLSGTTINSSTITVSSLLTASTINATNINFTTLIGDNLTVNQNMSVSSINAASSIKTQELIFSSLCMIPSTISSGVTTPLNSSILICLNGSYWKIPIEPV